MADKEVSFFIRAKDATAGAFSALSKRLKGLDGDLARLGKGINSVKGHFVALAGVLSVGAFAGAIKSQLEYAGTLEDGSKKTGVAIEDLQKLQYAADQSGSSAAEMTDALTKMNLVLGKVKAGDKKSINLLKDLGINPAEVTDAKDLLLKVAESFKQAGTSAEELQKKTGLLKQMKIDPAFIQTLDQGSEALINLGEQASALGLVISDEIVSELAELDDKINNVGKQAQVSGAIFTSGLAPALGNVAEAFLSAGKGGDFLRQAGVFVGDAIKGVIIVLAAAGTALYAFGQAGINAGDFVITKFRQVLVIMTSVARALTAVVEAGSFNPATMAKAAAKSIADSQAEVERLGKAGNQRVGERQAEIQAAFAANSKFSDKLLDPNYKEAAAKDADETKGVKALGSSSLSKGGKGGGEDKGVDKARAAVVKAEAEADAKIRTEAEKIHQGEIKDLLDDGEISYANYYDTLAKSQQKVIDIRLEALRIEAGEQEKLMNRSGAKESERLAAQAKFKTITGDIKVLELERGEIAGKAARDQKKDERELAKTLLDVTVQTKTLLDTLDDDDRLKVIRSKYEDMLKKVKSNGGESQVRDLMKRELSKANADASLDKIGKAETTLSSRTRSINANTGLSSIEKRSAITSANREAQAAIEAMLPALREQSKEFPEYANKVRDAESALADLKVAADEISTKLNEEIQGGLADALYNIGTGSKSPAQAFKDLFAGVGKSIAKQVSDDIASSFYTMMKNSGFNPGALISQLMSSGASAGTAGGAAAGAASSGGGVATFFNMVKGWLGFETGGYTGNGGTTAAAGVVHGQEFVLSAPAVKAIGVPFLNDFHQRLRGGAPKSPIGGLANGGLFAGGGSKSGSGSGGGPVVTNFNITTPNARSFVEAQGRINAKAAAAAQRAKTRNM